ncbi:HYDIN protein, partial [Malurus elegans]|nr:HYDIN protein [Malurus elegans]
LHLEDEQGVFFLKTRQSTLERFYTENVEEDSSENESKTPKKPFLLLHCGQTAAFDVTFKPTLAQRLEGKIRVLVGDVYSNKTEIELVGEGHKDSVTFEDIEEDVEERTAEISLKEDIIAAFRVNHIEFGDCPVGKRCYRTFTMINHSTTKVMRFEWETDAPFEFSPRVGHIHPRCDKVITVILKSDVPATFSRQLATCQVDRIQYDQPRRKVPDWDDTLHLVTWVDTDSKEPEAPWPVKDMVVEAVPEPTHTVVESRQEDEMYLSAFVSDIRFKMDMVVIQFKDTFPYYERMATFTMHNTGKVPLEYFWEEDAHKKPVEHKPYSRPQMR